MMRWGLPPLPKFGWLPVTNIRNTSSPNWRGWLKPENRCLVPANSFAEFAPEPNPETGKKDIVGFALNEDRPLFAFGGIWTGYNGDPGHEIQAGPRPSPRLWFSDGRTERSRRADPPEGDAGDPEDRRRARRMDARALG